MTTSTQTPREYLVAKGFTPGARGRFSAEQIAALREGGFSVKEPKVRSTNEALSLK